MRRTWIKLYVDQTLRGSCFDELLPDERFVWFGFLLLAGDNTCEGEISITKTIGYTEIQLAELLKCEVELIKRSIKKMIKVDKINVLEGNIIKIVNWQRYQSEYERLKKYKKGTKKVQKKVQRKVSKVDIDIERDIDIEEEREKDKNNTSSSKLKKVFDQESVEYKLSSHLWEKIKENNPRAKLPNLQVWAKNIDLMIRRDKRTLKEIEEIIDWCQADSFWYSNILSTKKLREKFDQLIIKRGNKKQKEDWRTT